MSMTVTRICDQQKIEAYGKFGDIEVWPGKPYPLGANWSPAGTNFALFSEHATRVDLCLYRPDDTENEAYRIQMMEQTDLVWHVYIPKLETGWRYGFRAHGEWNPKAGLTFNPNKLLIDPYTRAIDGVIDWHDAVFPYPIHDPDPERYLKMDELDSGPYITKGVVIDTYYDWEGDRLPEIPIHKTVIYEAHVKGLTQQHPDVPEEFSGITGGTTARAFSLPTPITLPPTRPVVRSGSLKTWLKSCTKRDWKSFLTLCITTRRKEITSGR